MRRPSVGNRLSVVCLGALSALIMWISPSQTVHGQLLEKPRAPKELGGLKQRSLEKVRRLRLDGFSPNTNGGAAEGGGAGALCQGCLVGTVECDDIGDDSLEAGDCELPGDGSFFDVWSIELEEPQELVIDYTSESFDTYLIVTDADCLGIAENDDRGDGSTNSRVRLTLAAGTYYVVANSFAAGEIGSYLLEVSCQEARLVCEGDCVVDSVACGDVVSGNLTGDECTAPNAGTLLDAYTLEIDEASNLSFSLNSPEFDTFLRIYDESCTQVILNDDCAPGNLNSCLVVNLPAGTWTVGVTTYAPGEIGAYTLTISECTEPVRICDGCEAGDAPCNGVVTGQLPRADCVLPGSGQNFEVWQLSLESDSDLRIDLTSVEVDTFLYLANADCVVIAQNDDCGADLNSCLELADVPAGQYFVVASTYAPGESGNYDLRVEAANCESGPSDCESCAQGALSCAGGVVNGALTGESCTLQGAGRVDYYDLVLAEATPVTIRTEAEFDTLLEIRDADCDRIFSNDDCDPGTLNSCIEVVLEPGSYSIGMAALFPGDVGPYSLTLECGGGEATALLGDCDANGSVNITDAVCLFNFLFRGGEVEIALPCEGNDLANEENITMMDWNADTSLNLTDGIGVLLFLFSGGPAHALSTGECVELPTCPATCAN